MVLWLSASGGVRCPVPLVSVAVLQLMPAFGSSQLFAAQVDNSTVTVPLSNVSTIGPHDYLDLENETKAWNVHDRQGHPAAASSEWDEFRLDQALFIYVIAGLCFVIMLVLGLKYVICDKNLKILKRTRREVLRKAGYRQPVEFSSTGQLMVSAKV